jgi:hypothetical protein
MDQIFFTSDVGNGKIVNILHEKITFRVKGPNVCHFVKEIRK